MVISIYVATYIPVYLQLPVIIYSMHVQLLTSYPYKLLIAI